mmetsp:Transcript_29576/g.71466  ORF Transcript_29576/g.71466 Transcript_29576/m.71466 type:complete len:107 (-) Transcript_29576:807-1127(-)
MFVLDAVGESRTAYMAESFASTTIQNHTGKEGEKTGKMENWDDTHWVICSLLNLQDLSTIRLWYNLIESKASLKSDDILVVVFEPLTKLTSVKIQDVVQYIGLKIG